MKLKSLIVFFVIFNLFASPIYAKKPLIRRQVSQTSATHPYGAWAKPKLRADRNALLLILGGMNYARSVTYTLSYYSGSVAQGVEGTYDPNIGNNQKEIIFGTCSGLNCTYHTNITDMVLTLKISLTSGKTLYQRYQIKP